MSSWWETLLRCPVCGKGLERNGNTLLCTGARRHAFDMASAGYVNLAPARASGGGDDAALIGARTAFLNGGHYAPIADGICEALCTYAHGDTVLDAGCGEGYYSLYMCRNGMKTLGVDLSKQGILHAAKSAKRTGCDAFFAVGSVFELPVASESLDAVVSVFAPVAEEEFSRVLKPGGILVLAGAGAEHLFSMKRVLYDTPYLNEPRADAPERMALLERRRIRYVTQLDSEMLGSLFAMTPYAYRTSREGKARLDATDSLGVDVDVELAIYRR